MDPAAQWQGFSEGEGEAREGGQGAEGDGGAWAGELRVVEGVEAEVRGAVDGGGPVVVGAAEGEDVAGGEGKEDEGEEFGGGEDTGEGAGGGGGGG